MTAIPARPIMFAMARPAPGAERAVAVLNHLAAHPRETLTLSELARRLDLNKATCHALLTTLTDAGYLLRHPTQKTYSLGPALIALGNAALAGFDVVDHAREEMGALADELGLECLASAAVGEEIVILARSGPPAPLGVSAQVGQRLPLVPPLGTVFLAWSGAEEIDEWLRRVGPRARPAELARYREALAAVRARGYAVALEADARLRLGAALAGNRRVRGIVEELGHEEYILVEVERSASYQVNHIAAPVFDADGAVALALTLVGFRDQLAAAQVPSYGERLIAATRAVTRRWRAPS